MMNEQKHIAAREHDLEALKGRQQARERESWAVSAATGCDCEECHTLIRHIEDRRKRSG